jgi:hypothetical protein
MVGLDIWLGKDNGNYPGVLLGVFLYPLLVFVIKLFFVHPLEWFIKRAKRFFIFDLLIFTTAVAVILAVIVSR